MRFDPHMLLYVSQFDVDSSFLSFPLFSLGNIYRKEKRERGGGSVCMYVNVINDNVYYNDIHIIIYLTHFVLPLVSTLV